jgi:hypothetical protein
LTVEKRSFCLSPTPNRGDFAATALFFTFAVLSFLSLHGRHLAMLYLYKEIQDEFGNRLNIRFGRPVTTLEAARRALQRLDRGEIRDQSNRLLVVKAGADVKSIRSMFDYLTSQ